MKTIIQEKPANEWAVILCNAAATMWKFERPEVSHFLHREGYRNHNWVSCYSIELKVVVRFLKETTRPPLSATSFPRRSSASIKPPMNQTASAPLKYADSDRFKYRSPHFEKREPTVPPSPYKLQQIGFFYWLRFFNLRPVIELASLFREKLAVTAETDAVMATIVLSPARGWVGGVKWPKVDVQGATDFSPRTAPPHALGRSLVWKTRRLCHHQFRTF